MKQSFHFHGLLFFFLVILLFTHTTTARYHMGLIKEGNTNTERQPQMGHSKEVQEEEDSFMMVLEDCDHNGGVNASRRDCFLRLTWIIYTLSNRIHEE
ncbi:hypothetical protein QJS10_CPA08g00559 [Acorus calamus]|uniref:Phytosulfokine-beta n=1 Tax=Acorus calamus TaxID=4465 RepID=A0AAV9E7G6_ACOCL|nr:hypothetical protein QJS10_CPA08g00559 [Acorus calamus]